MSKISTTNLYQKNIFFSIMPLLSILILATRQPRLFCSKGNLLSKQNVNGYLIVPTDYSVQTAVGFAKVVSNEMSFYATGANGLAVPGLENALRTMVEAFWDGPQDLQRSYNGQTGQPFVRAFTDAASFNLGLITAYSGLPLSWSEEGGGLLNRINKHFNSKIDTSGVDGNTPLNSIAIPAGYQFGSTLPGANTNLVPIRLRLPFRTEAVATIRPCQYLRPRMALRMFI